MPDEDTGKAAIAYFELAAKLARLHVTWFADADQPARSIAEKSVIEQRTRYRSEAAIVVRRLFLAGERWNLDVSPLLHCLLELEGCGRATCLGDCGLRGESSEVVRLIEARCKIESIRPLAVVPAAIANQPSPDNSPIQSPTSNELEYRQLIAATPNDRLRKLREAFHAATDRFKEISEFELLPSGKPCFELCANAMLAYAYWFGAQEPDDSSIHGNAYRVFDALEGLSGVLDWIGLHKSVPFSNELEQGVTALVEEAEAFDEIVADWNTVSKTPNGITYHRKEITDSAYSDWEERISRIAGMAQQLGNRLMRLALWARDLPTDITNAERKQDAERIETSPAVSSLNATDQKAAEYISTNPGCKKGTQ